MDVEVTLELHVDPVVHRIAEGVGHGLSESLEFIAGISIAGDAVFTYAVGAQQPPLVMVAAKPEVRDIFPPVVRGDLFWREMAVVINNRLTAGHLVEKAAGCFGMK